MSPDRDTLIAALRAEFERLGVLEQVAVAAQRLLRAVPLRHVRGQQCL